MRCTNEILAKPKGPGVAPKRDREGFSSHLVLRLALPGTLISFINCCPCCEPKFCIRSLSVIAVPSAPWHKQGHQELDLIHAWPCCDSGSRCLEQFRVQRELYRGKTSAVFLTRDVVSGMDVVLKLDRKSVV